MYFAPMKWRILLLPFSLLYGVAVVARNLLYSVGIFKSHRFSVPVISVGNLTVGGSGKTPMTEHIIRLLSSDYRVATLSRGYGRKTSGFVLVSSTTNAALIGDEPMLYHTKYGSVTVATCESRKEGIEKLLSLEAKPQIILLDDAYQHRSVKPGLNILLIEYDTINRIKILLPAGDFREPFASKRRADVVVVTKCPASLDDHKRRQIEKKINPSFRQQVWFSYTTYDEIRPFESYVKRGEQPERKNFSKSTKVLLLTGIANPLPLKSYVERTFTLARMLRYADHYEFSETDIKRMRKIFSNIVGEEKIILTTEKDAMRLMKAELIPLLSELPVYVIPVRIKFLQKYSEAADNTILEYARKNSTNR
jgi:tetraacyldisaccharide 4'-kinase